MRANKKPVYQGLNITIQDYYKSELRGNHYYQADFYPIWHKKQLEISLQLIHTEE